MQSVCQCTATDMLPAARPTVYTARPGAWVLDLPARACPPCGIGFQNHVYVSNGSLFLAFWKGSLEKAFQAKRICIHSRDRARPWAITSHALRNACNQIYKVDFHLEANASWEQMPDMSKAWSKHLSLEPFSTYRSRLKWECTYVNTR